MIPQPTLTDNFLPPMAAHLPQGDGGWHDTAPRHGPTHRAPRIRASRWTGSLEQTSEKLSQIDSSEHLITIALRSTNAAISVEQKPVHDGRVPQGTMVIGQSGQSLRMLFRGCYDVLHFHIPNPLLADCIKATRGDSPAGTKIFGDARICWDPVIERLTHAFMNADEIGGSFAPTYADSIGTGIIARLLDRHSHFATSPYRPRVAALAKWRLKRVTDYIATHLADSIGLAELAATSGLSRMHFAAQFRVATGMRPHEYLLRQRIERAQSLLAARHAPLCEVALDVGFKTQAHFTSVFSRIVGDTPHVWRQKNCRTQ